MDWAGLAGLTTAIGALVLGLLAFVATRRKDGTAADAAEASASAKATEVGLAVMGAALEMQGKQIDKLSREVIDLREAVLRCEREKHELATEVRRLEGMVR